MSAVPTSRRAQRRLVLVVLWAIAAALIWFAPVHSNRAEAQSQSSSYEPFACAKNGGGDYRQTVKLANDNISGTTSGVAYPCLAGTPWRMQAGNLTDFNANSVDGYDIAYVDGIYAPSSGTYYSAAGANTTLYRIAFKNLQICTGKNAPASGCGLSANNTDSATNNDLSLYADSSAMSVSPKPKNAYVLRFAPNGPITIGGSGVITDVLSAGNSKFSVDVGDVVLGSLGCTVAGGTVVGGFIGIGAHTCQGITVSSMSGLSWLTGVQSYHIREIDLTFYYLITHSGTTTDPYTDPPGGTSSPKNSIQLPNTRLTVCPTTTACTPSP